MKLIYFTAAALLFVSCTDLEVEELDSRWIESESGQFAGVDPVATLASAYTDLRGLANQENFFALQEITSDELLVPTRGTDWGDNGVWRTLHQHNWDATHPYVLNTWNDLNARVFKTNQILAPESNADATQTAEAKFLRAFNMYFVLDLYGQVPFREVSEGVEVDPRVLSASEAFDFILADITSALENLPEIGPGDGTIRASKAAAHFLRAKLYLNKHVFLGADTPDPADMTEVVNSVDAIQAAGFVLQEGYFDIFKPDADTETILWTDASWGNRIWNGLHYFQTVPDNQGGGWNGFATTAEFYATFEGSSDANTLGSGQEERRGYVPTDSAHYGIGFGFLFGQQYSSEGIPLNNRSGRPLIFTKDYITGESDGESLIGNGENNGIRIIKYHPEGGAFVNYFILFRYADAYLMKAEAILRGGTSAEDPTTMVNELRAIRKASPLASVGLEELLDERGRELYTEGWRRNDQIRFGTYVQEWLFKDNTEDFRGLFPIPANALATNPNLVQNPGY